MPFSYISRPAPILPPGTFTLGGSEVIVYKPLAPPLIAGTPRDLSATVRWPSGTDPLVPRPLVILVGTLGFANSFHTIFEQEALYLVGCGCIVAVINTRVIGDDPISNGDLSTHNSMRRAIRAGIFDVDDAIAYFMGVGRQTENYTIGRVYTGGASSGGMLAAFQQVFVVAPRKVAGIFMCAAAFSGDSVEVEGETVTSIIRASLGFTEAALTTPVCLTIDPTDSTLGPTWATAMRERALAIAGSHVHDYIGFGHSMWGNFPEEELTDTGNPPMTHEKVFTNFIASREAALGALGGGPTFAA